MSDAYEFRVAGRLSHDLMSTFEPTESRRERDETVFVCPVGDDGEFFGVIARCEALGLKLLSLRQVPRTQQQSPD